jgi:hypothetical protein
MKRIKFLLAALSIVLAANTYAQETPAKRGLSVSVGPELAIPLGKFRNNILFPGSQLPIRGYKAGFGGSAKLNIPVATNIDLTLSAGYMAFSQKASFDTLRTISVNKNSYTLVPFKAGLRFRLNGGFYVEPQVGYTQTKIKNEEGAGYFTYAGNIGYLISRSVDIAVRYESVSRTGGNLNFAGLRIAYNIPFARDRSTSTSTSAQ